MIVYIGGVFILYYHSVGRAPLAIRFAYGFPLLYQFVYPIPVRSRHQGREKLEARQ